MKHPGRLARLEARCGQGGRCPHCRGQALVCVASKDGPNGERRPSGEMLPPPCAACGRPADVIEVVEVLVVADGDGQAVRA